MLPVVDVRALVDRAPERAAVAARIGEACREAGFFYIVGHGVPVPLQERLERRSREFFAQDGATKLAIAMSHGGRAWRGYFPVGAELTSGRPDNKEGLYFGAELGFDDARVRARRPLHGPNLFPAEPPELRATVLEYMESMTRLGHALMEGLALSLGLDASYFADRYTSDPLTLFRIFNYPAEPAAGAHASWGVGEHTDYGVLTILKQDGSGGLSVKSRAGWQDAPPLENSFVCNIGDMLDRMTGGLYRSTAHRVRNTAGRDRLSFPFFFDPNWDAAVVPIDGLATPAGGPSERWDGADLHAFFAGTYGDYVLAKVSKVFPQFRAEIAGPT